MANCVNCYETNTIEPCESVGCLSTNYGKCITYSGSNLFCEKGSVNTFTFTGTAVAPTTTTTVEVVATGGTGSDVTFNVTRTAGQITYLVTLSDGGSAYTLGNTLTIAGTALGGASPANNITITVTALAPIIATGDDLDSIITNFNARLCSAGDGYNNVDLSGYNYYCLRLGGNLESVGAPITNAQGVVESMSAALCSLNTRLKAVEKPAITVASCFTGTLTSGTSTLVQILNEYGSKICTHNTNLTMTGVTGNPCISYSWTAKPTSNNISEYINWVSTNVCGIFTLLNGNIGAVSVKEQEIRNYITGTTTGTIPTSINTSCLTGGSTTSSLKDAMTLIVSQLCATITTVNSLAPSSYTVSYGSCFNGTYPSNSVFNAQSLGTFTSTTTLQNHLNQIASALGALNIKFNSSQFTIASTPCGPTISLLSGSTFTCSSLSTCTLENMGDVTYTSVSQHAILTRINSTTWDGARIRTGVYRRVAGSTQQTEWSIPYTYNSSGNYIEGAIELPIFQNNTLLPVTGGTFLTGGAYLIDLGRNCTQYPSVRHFESSGLATFQSGTSGFKLTNAAGTTQLIPNNQGVNCFQATSIGLAGGVGSLDCLVPVQHFTSGGTLSGIYMMTLRIADISAISFIRLFNYTGSTISLNSGDYFQINMGGITWSVIA
jgi:hypothetical protein